MRFGKYLCELRESHDLTQEDISEAIGCSTQYVSNVERGLSHFSPEALRSLCKRYRHVFKYNELSELTVKERISNLAERARANWGY